MRIAIVGAGMAGLACAEKLVGGGHDVTLFDKGSRPGGRMSTRVLQSAVGNIAFDYGAQYMTARDGTFCDRVERWHRAGLVARWPTAGEDAWVGVPGMSAPIVDMAERLDVRWSTRLATLRDENGQWHLDGDGSRAGGFEAVVIAIPAQQVVPLLENLDSEAAAIAEATHSQPCWTLMVGFSAALPIGMDVFKDDGIVSWAARNSAKPGRSGPEAWVIQANPTWSMDNLERGREAIVPDLLKAFADRTGLDLPKPLAIAAHRWRFARSGRADARYLWNAKRQIGVCGDWLIGPKVEAAWLSGSHLAAAMTGRTASAP